MAETPQQKAAREAEEAEDRAEAAAAAKAKAAGTRMHPARPFTKEEQRAADLANPNHPVTALQSNINNLRAKLTVNQPIIMADLDGLYILAEKIRLGEYDTPVEA